MYPEKGFRKSFLNLDRIYFRFQDPWQFERPLGILFLILDQLYNLQGPAQGPLFRND